MMLTKKKNAIFGRYPCCDLINNAIRGILDGRTDYAVSELVQAISKSGGYMHEDIAERANEVNRRVWVEKCQK